MTRLLNAFELSRYLSIKRKTIYELVRKGEIPHIRAGRLIRFKLESIEVWLERKSVEVVEKKKPEPKPRRVKEGNPAVQKLAQEILERRARSSKHDGKSSRIGTQKGESR